MRGLVPMWTAADEANLRQRVRRQHLVPKEPAPEGLPSPYPEPSETVTPPPDPTEPTDTPAVGDEELPSDPETEPEEAT